MLGGISDPRRRRRLSPDEPPRRADAARAARAAPLRARHGRVGRLPADRRVLRTPARFAGRDQVSASQKMLRFAIDGITSFSSSRCALRPGSACSPGSWPWLTAAWAIYEQLFGSGVVHGWTTIMIAVALGSVGAAADDGHAGRVRRAHLRRDQAPPALHHGRRNQLAVGRRARRRRTESDDDVKPALARTELSELPRLRWPWARSLWSASRSSSPAKWVAYRASRKADFAERNTLGRARPLGPVALAGGGARASRRSWGSCWFRARGWTRRSRSWSARPRWFRRWRPCCVSVPAFSEQARERQASLLPDRARRFWRGA